MCVMALDDIFSMPPVALFYAWQFCPNIGCLLYVLYFHMSSVIFH